VELFNETQGRIIYASLFLSFVRRWWNRFRDYVLCYLHHWL